MDEIARRIAESIADRYHIERKLGAGGMADVFLARDLRHDREIAIKVMRPELAQTLGTERFLREIRLLARLQHPNILSLVDSGEAGGLVYYVMPYLPTGTLRDRLNRERELPIADALQILREIAGALEHAHSMNIVHRDIKPENVLFNAGHAQVADFGIARLVSDIGRSEATITALTSAGVTIGTPQYMAPEQAAGDPKTDHRADLYAFGVVAYELLAGVPPFVAGSAAELAALRLTQDPIPLSNRRPSVPGSLEELVMRCLQKRPADRWQSSGDLIGALSRVDRADSAVRSASRGGGTVTSRLPITESVARRLDRRSFDPRMIGDSLEYLDNQADSDVLAFLLNAAWLDGSDFEPHLRMLPYRCIAPTLYGFAAGARHRFALSLRDHVALLSELLNVTVKKCSPSLIIVVGFSASGDLVLKLASTTPDGGRAPDGVLALGPNQGIETCFISAVLAKLESNDPAQLLAAFKSISGTASSLDDWLLLNGYLGRIMSRFRADVSPLRALARDIIEPFERDNPGAFAQMYRETASRIRYVRCIFEDSETCNRLLRNLLTDHMDKRILGEHHRDGALLIEPTPSHFDLLQPERLAAHLATMVNELRETRD
jgi:serine/threonine protein kinase/pimeloyl-ACP methyl ester carboxylesterase